jgi:sigma-B regulation protein RsbU (phosphoserine phosphatase)
VGGDYYDYFLIDDARIAVVIADVSGHGVGAGIIAAMTKSALYLQVTKDPSPLQMMNSINDALTQITNKRTFVTCAYLLLDRRTMKLSYATAGHPPLLMKSAGQIRELATKNLALGVRRDISFTQDEVSISPGDSFLLYTDGISDATNRDGKVFGTRGVASVFRTTEFGAMLDQMIRVPLQFSGGEAKDDATVVCVEIPA